MTNKMRSALCLMAALLAAHLGGPRYVRAQNATLYEGARLIIGDESPPIENSAFVVDGGRFTRIGQRGQVQAPPGAARVDLTGKTVMPALVSTHFHMGPGRGGPADEAIRNNHDDFVSDLHTIAYAGYAVGTSMGWDLDVAFQVRAEYWPDAARLLTGGTGVTAPLGQHPETLALHEAGLESRYEEAMSDNTVWLMSPQQARVYVVNQAIKRPDFIKLWVDNRLGMELQLSPEIYGAVIDEAHKHDIPVYAHLFYLEDAKGLARAGADMFAHPVRDTDIDEERIQLMKDRHVVQQTNMVGTWGFTITEADAKTFYEDPLFQEIASPQQIQRFRTQAAMDRVPPRTHEGQGPDVDGREFSKVVYETIVRNTRRLYDAGVTLALGTDGFRVFEGHKELELLVEDVGLTPAQAISIATRNAANALHLTDLGTIESGKTASFVVLDANPLDNIVNTRKIADVYLRGHRVDREMIRRTYLAGTSGGGE